MPRLGDAPKLVAAYSDPAAMRFIDDGLTTHLGGVEEAIGKWLALRDWALRDRGLTRLISLIQHGNLRSVRVAERLGERYERDVVVRGVPTRLFSLAA